MRLGASSTSSCSRDRRGTRPTPASSGSGDDDRRARVAARRAARARAAPDRAAAPRGRRRAPGRRPRRTARSASPWSHVNHDMFSITPTTPRFTFSRHVRGALRDLLRRGLRRRDDDDLGARQELRHRQRDVAGAGRHVDDEEVGLAPVHVGEELLERLVQHRAAPDDGLVFAREEAHRDQRDAVGLGRDDHVVDDGRRAVDAEHARHREAPHVGVDGGDRVAALRERDREVGGDRRLADAALARRDREHARARSR